MKEKEEQKKEGEIGSTEWMELEEHELEQNKADFEELPGLKLEENKIVEFTVDFSKPFEKWNGDNNGRPVTKAIIPVTHEGEKKNFWLNIKNPLYKDLIQAGRKGTTTFKVMQTGSKQNTKYVLVK